MQTDANNVPKYPKVTRPSVQAAHVGSLLYFNIFKCDLVYVGG